MRQYEMFELTFNGPELEENFHAADLCAEFTGGGETKSVSGFYCGEGVYKVRFLPKKPGSYSWKVSGVIEAQGEDECKEAAPDFHGMVQADKTSFRYEDGKLFHPFGTTVYALISQTDALIEQTMDTLEKAPFNKIRMCVFPKSYEFNQDDPSYYAFEKTEDGSWDTTRPNYLFWDALDRHITRLGNMGIQVDLILFHPYDRWGFDGMGLEKDKQYLEYLIRRLSAFPNIWWSLANEYELTHRTLEEWYEIESFVASRDPYGHLLSCHNIFKVWDAGRPLITHASIQSKELTKLKSWIKKFNAPVMLDECAYEGNIEQFWGSITGEEMTRRFWRTVCCGAYCTHGETFYSEDDVLWWAKGGVLKGTSPERIAFCRNIIESLPGHLEGEAAFMERMLPLLHMDEAEQEKTLGQLRNAAVENPGAEGFLRMIQAFLASGDDAEGFCASEMVWYAHIGTDCYLRFHDMRPLVKDTLELPSDRTYTIRVLDVWNMTDTVVARGISGKYTVELPGRENMAVLALAE